MGLGDLRGCLFARLGAFIKREAGRAGTGHTLQERVGFIQRGANTGDRRTQRYCGRLEVVAPRQSDVSRRAGRQRTAILAAPGAKHRAGRQGHARIDEQAVKPFEAGVVQRFELGPRPTPDTGAAFDTG